MDPRYPGTWLSLINETLAALLTLLLLWKELRDTRKAHGYNNAEELAWDLDVDTKTVLRWERGESFPHGKNARKLEQILKLNIRSQAFNGISLQQARLQRGWTVEQAAQALNVSPSTFQRWEAGTHSPRKSKINDINHTLFS